MVVGLEVDSCSTHTNNTTLCPKRDYVRLSPLPLVWNSSFPQSDNAIENGALLGLIFSREISFIARVEALFLVNNAEL